MPAPRKNRKINSTTSPKSSETQTESQPNDSQESTPQSDETSTQTTSEGITSSSTLSEEDQNEALFAEADGDAEDGAQSDEEGDDEDQDEDSENVSPEAAERNLDVNTVTADTGTPLVNEYGVKATGDLHEFHVTDDRGDYSFSGHVQHNVIIVAEAAWREVPLRNTSMKTRLLAHHKGQTLPLASFEKFSDSLKKDQED